MERSLEETIRERLGETDGVASRLLFGAIAMYQPREVGVVAVDGWFDSKWCGFGGKLMGALAVWPKELPLPPFHPNRILSELFFERVGGDYRHVERVALHVDQPSDANMRRRVDALFGGRVAIVWIGRNAAASRVAIMVYVTVSDSDPVSWYVGFAGEPEPKLTAMQGISREEVRRLSSAGT